MHRLVTEMYFGMFYEILLPVEEFLYSLLKEHCHGSSAVVNFIRC